MNKLTQRYLYFALGLAINSFGIAFITKSALGTSPISSVPYVLSLNYTSISFGTFTFILNMGFILVQFLLLSKEFQPVQLLQIVVNLVFSSLIDVSMELLSWFSPATLLVRCLSLLLGCLILGTGIAVEVAPDVIVVPGEGIVGAIAYVTKQEFGRVKIFFDCTLMLTSLILSFVFFGSMQGIGIGTIISALLVGRIVSFMNMHLPLIRRIRGLRGKEAVKDVLLEEQEKGE